MVWDDTLHAQSTGRDEPIELVGTHLRLTGIINIGRYSRLTDLINASSGYVRVRDARLLHWSGEPTNLVLPELMVDVDEISFIAQAEDPAPAPEAAETKGYVEPGFGDATETRRAREFVFFTPGHTVTGLVYVFGQVDVAGFVDSDDPRFVPVTNVVTRSLADRKIISQYAFVLINRTQMIAASEVAVTGDDPTATTTTTDATDGSTAPDAASLEGLAPEPASPENTAPEAAGPRNIAYGNAPES